jgi:hypothetical protein
MAAANIFTIKLVRPEQGSPQISTKLPRGSPQVSASTAGKPVEAVSTADRAAPWRTQGKRAAKSARRAAAVAEFRFLFTCGLWPGSP